MKSAIILGVLFFVASLTLDSGILSPKLVLAIMTLVSYFVGDQRL